MVEVLDKGFVELEDFMGGDLRVVNSAKVSNHKRSEEMGGSEEKLINYLMKNRHGSPFEHSCFTFYVKAPIFVVREWQRHRIGSFNEMSGRYVQFEPDFYIPEQVRVPGTTNKQGSKIPTELSDLPEDLKDVVEPDVIDRWNIHAREELLEAYTNSYDDYKYLLNIGVAKEMARMVLPLSLYTEMFWTVNARSLMNFLNLRTGENAQWEIRQYADAIELIFAEKMPVAWDAWRGNGKLAP
jgi:thymidylate synthase (FAD)